MATPPKKEAFKAGRPEPEYPPQKARKEAEPPAPAEPVYYGNARFLKDPSGKVYVEIKADAYNLVGPSPATDEDKKTFAQAWKAYQDGQQPEVPPPPAPAPVEEPPE